MIYDGESARANDTLLNMEKSIYNPGFNDNMYVGFKYAHWEVHGKNINSTILQKLNIWYNNNLTSYATNLDPNVGFCGDRMPSSNTNAVDNSGGIGTTITWYAGYIRLNIYKKPDLSCENLDLYTVSDATKGNKTLEYPIGLITADEVSMAGGAIGKQNSKYYLHTNTIYWTMTPFAFAGDVANVFSVNQDGQINAAYTNTEYGIRPVINLRTDVKLTGTGTMTDPYVVE